MNELGGPAEIARPSINSSGPIKNKSLRLLEQTLFLFIYLRGNDDLASSIISKHDSQSFSLSTLR
jgi:hypothetical protein